jgi:hypothetical protein
MVESLVISLYLCIARTRKSQYCHLKLVHIMLNTLLKRTANVGLKFGTFVDVATLFDCHGCKINDRFSCSTTI